MNRLLSTAIGGKTPLDIWSVRAAQDYGLLRVLDVRPISVSKRQVKSANKKVCVFGYQEEYESLQAMGPEKQEDCAEQACHV